jgi:hypothetical protein
LLRRNLETLRLTSHPGNDEVIVVDNHSSDDSVTIVHESFPEVEVIENRCNRGFAAACNQGIARARGEFVLLLNNDAFLVRDTLDRLEETLRRNPRAAIVSPQLVNGDGDPLQSERSVPTLLDELGVVFGKRRGNRFRARTELAEVEAVPGACVAVRTESIRQVGTLEERFFFYFEDLEWCRRFRRAGWRVLLDPGIRAVHLGAVTSRVISRAAQLELLRSRLTFYRLSYPIALALFLEVFRTVRITANAATQLLLTVVTVGRSKRARRKLKDYAVLLAWLLVGKPASWGFPDRCTCRNPAQCLKGNFPTAATPSR